MAREEQIKQQAKLLCNNVSPEAHIIGTADHIKIALDVMERKGGEK